MSIINNSDTTASTKQLPKLTRKQANFVKGILENPKLSGTEIASQVYNVRNRNVAESIASENLRKPAIMLHLQNHSAEAELRVLEMMKQDEDKRLAFDASRDILDRVHGKATQRVEQQSTSVNISIDLT